MATSVFEKNIASLDFTFKKKNDEGGVVLTSDYYDPKKAPNLTPQELFALETAQRFDAHAVYFRYFNDGRESESIPQVYIYDYTNNKITTEDEIEIHKKVWSGCIIPIFIIVEKTRIRIFDSRQIVKGKDLSSSIIDTITLTGKALKSFSAKGFDDGMFWEDDRYGKNFEFNTSAYKELIEGLKEVYKNFIKESKLEPKVALKLLVQCLLIKYLEERDEDDKCGYLAENYFKKDFKCDNFCDVIRQGQLLVLLDKLAKNFNGKIFEWSEDNEHKERQSIGKTEVKILADYLDGNSKKQQYVLWRLYSFSHLPVELISSVYEELLKDGKGMVYTPDVIASTLIDECMPLKNPMSDFKVIDVSCGSGIFLVKAYKRIIQWWRYERWKETGILERPDSATLKKLLRSSIYGIDINGGAIRLSIFSLSLALLDELKPKEYWNKLKFEDLSKDNILEKDFFKFITNSPPKDFDLVIGNPPFNPPNGISNGDYKKQLIELYLYECKVKVPDHNLALTFLVESLKLLKPNALLCLIQPSGPLLYQKDETFKRQIFSKNNLLQIIDFTKLGDTLWGKASVATAAVFIRNSTPDEKKVAHIIVRRSSANIKKLFLELDHYDSHFIDRESVLSNPYVWKANSLGGGRVVQLIERLSKLRTLDNFLEKKVRVEGWKVGEGFKEIGKKNKADFITDKDYLPTEAFTEEGIDWNQVNKCDIKYFHNPRNQYLYSPPHILIKENIGNRKLLVDFSDKYLTFRDSIIGIYAPIKFREELLELYHFIREYSELLRFYIIATSGKLSIDRAKVILMKDFMNLPYPEKISGIKFTNSEKILIKDCLNYFLGGKSQKALNLNAVEQDLKSFAKVFNKVLNSVYQNKTKEFRLIKILDSGNYFALHFEYTNKEFKLVSPEDVDLNEYIEAFIPTEPSKHQKLHIQRILKLYGKDSIILIKPKNLRYWLESIALRDADETFADYVNAGF